MDIHLLARVEDDASPFGVEYSTRRLTRAPSGEVTCDRPDDWLWRELAGGIQDLELKRGKSVRPTDGDRFLDCVSEYLRYHFLGPFQPLVYDWRGRARPDDFRLIWRESSHLGWAHGYQFLCESSIGGDLDDVAGFVPVARTDGWRFYHEFANGSLAGAGAQAPRAVAVDLLPEESRVWETTVFGSTAGPRETKAFVRAFFRRFFERQNAGLRLDFESGVQKQRQFAWRGGF
jgi:hypothetical protein